MENSTNRCSVPDCPNKHKARGVCEYHYHVWRNLSLGFEEVEPYVRQITSPIRSCSHPREGSNLAPGERCRMCLNEIKRRRYAERRAQGWVKNRKNRTGKGEGSANG